MGSTGTLELPLSPQQDLNRKSLAKPGLYITRYQSKALLPRVRCITLPFTTTPPQMHLWMVERRITEVGRGRTRRRKNKYIHTKERKKERSTHSHTQHVHLITYLMYPMPVSYLRPHRSKLAHYDTCVSSDSASRFWNLQDGSPT